MTDTEVLIQLAAIGLASMEAYLWARIRTPFMFACFVFCVLVAVT